MTHPAADGGCPEAKKLWVNAHKHLIARLDEIPETWHPMMKGRIEAQKYDWNLYLRHIAKCERCQQLLREMFEREVENE